MTTRSTLTYRRPITSSDEFERIMSLPRYDMSEFEKELVETLTQEFRTEGGTQTLRPIQALGLASAYEARGLFGFVGVGHGKTLLSFLLPRVLSVKNPLLLVPANLVKKAQRDRVELAKHWKIYKDMNIASYHELSTAPAEGADDLLNRLKPDCIIADEGHKLKEVTTAGSRRFLSYMKNNPDTVFVYLSGTPTRKSVKDYWHLIGLALRHNSPLPLDYYQIENWASVLDAEYDERLRLAPGVLLDFCTSEQKQLTDKYKAARLGFQNRLISAPGVVATDEVSVNMPIEIRQRKITLPQNVLDTLKTLRGTWTTPFGDEIEDAVRLYAYIRQITQGFYYQWDPKPPQEWISARKAWNTFVRNILSRNKPGLDSPLQVSRAFNNHVDYIEWLRVRDMFDPEANKKPVWIDDFLLLDACKWLKEHKGIAWVEHVAVGERLALLSGVPYYGSGEYYDSLIEQEKGPFIASISSHGTGKNLQHFHNKNLVLSCPPSNSVWEQLIGRTHRIGQTADQVTFDVYLPISELREGMKTALKDAHYVQDSTGQQQKLLFADISQLAL